MSYGVWVGVSYGAIVGFMNSLENIVYSHSIISLKQKGKNRGNILSCLKNEGKKYIYKIFIIF